MNQDVRIEKQEVAPDQLYVKDAVRGMRSLNRYLISKWKIIVLAGLLCGAIGVLYGTFKKVIYTAECTFVLEEKAQGGNLGQYSALASMAGIDIGGGGNGLFQTDNIIELYKSRSIMEKTLLTRVDFNGKKQLLIDRFIEFNKLRSSWNEQGEKVSFDIPVEQFTVKHDSLINIIISDLKKNSLTVDKPDKRLGIISVKLNSADPYFAKAFTESIVQNVNTFYILTKTQGTAQNLILFKRQVDSLRSALNHAIRGSASAQDANPDPNPALQILKVPSQNRQIDIQANSVMYTEAIKNLELTRAALQRERPLIQVIDKPVLPLPNNKSSRLKALISGFFIGVMICVIVLAANKFYNKFIIN